MDIRSGVIIFGVYIFQAGWMDGGVEGGSFFFFLISKWQSERKKKRWNNESTRSHGNLVTGGHLLLQKFTKFRAIQGR